MRRRWADRFVGVIVGIALGLGVLVYFVFVHSEGSIDAPRIGGAGSGIRSTGAENPGTSPHRRTPGQPREGAQAKSGSTRRTSRVPVVEVIGGAPPTAAGPKTLKFNVGEKVRFEIATDEPFAFEIRGLNISRSIDGPSVISFRAKKTGQFPVIASSTLIGVADLLIKKRAE